MIDFENLNHWFEHHALGQHLCDQERAFFNKILRNKSPRCLLSYSDFFLSDAPLHIVVNKDVRCGVLLPFQDNVFDVIFAPHVLDKDMDFEHRQILLHEWYRVVSPQGFVILTGFNPFSLWRWGNPKNVPPVKKSVALTQLKSDLAQTHWHIEQGAFLNYLPPVAHAKTIEKWRFMEKIGNRWFPHGSAVYALVLSKQSLIAPPLAHHFIKEWFVPPKQLSLAKR